MFIYLLTGSALIRSQKESEAYNENDDELEQSQKFGSSIKDFPATLLALLKNPPFVLSTLAVCADGVSSSGGTLFNNKFIQNQFQQTAGDAAIVSGKTEIRVYNF